MSPFGRQMSPFGRQMSPLHFYEKMVHYRFGSRKLFEADDFSYFSVFVSSRGSPCRFTHLVKHGHWLQWIGNPHQQFWRDAFSKFVWNPEINASPDIANGVGKICVLKRRPLQARHQVL